jgi:hypothetical protein
MGCKRQFTESVSDARSQCRLRPQLGREYDAGADRLPLAAHRYMRAIGIDALAPADAAQRAAASSSRT